MSFARKKFQPTAKDISLVLIEFEADAAAALCFAVLLFDLYIVQLSFEVRHFFLRKPEKSDR